MLRLPVLLVLSTLAYAQPAAAQPADAALVFAAERAFAADSLSFGLEAASRTWAAPDAVGVVEGEARRGRARLDPHAAPEPAGPGPVWTPRWAGIAKSGDLGFTAGVMTVGAEPSGLYFTIWTRQANGRWRWVYRRWVHDGGVLTDFIGAADRETLAVLPTAILGSTSVEAARSEVGAVEAVLAASALRDQKAAHLALLAPDGRLHVAGRLPAIGARDFGPALDALPNRLSLGLALGGGASNGGDMVWTHGRAAWAGGAGDYVRLWQKRLDGWVLVFTQITPDPLPAGG